MGREPQLILRKQDNGTEVKVKSGQSIQIELEAMGGTGYWWYMRSTDARYLELLGEKTVTQEKGRVGGQVLAVWTFQAKRPGITEVQMNYYRSWEGVEKAIDEFRVTITVE